MYIHQFQPVSMGIQRYTMNQSHTTYTPLSTAQSPLQSVQQSIPQSLQHDGTVCLYAESRNHTCGRHWDSLSGHNQSPPFASKPNGNEAMTLAIAFTNDHGHRHRQQTANQREPNDAAPRRRPDFSRRTVESPDCGHIIFTQYNAIPTLIIQHTMKHTA